jgi:ADP-ribose pyrophosphatase
MKESWINSNYVYKGRVVSLRVGEVRLEDGRTSTREIIEHSGGAAVVPVLDNKSVIMVRQFRVSIGKEILELPGGRLEPDELPELCARRELEEETGYQATSLVRAACFYSSPGFTDERIYIYLGFGLKKIVQSLEWDENVRLVELPFGEIWRMLGNNEFEDANAVIGLHRLVAYLQSHSNDAE